MAIKYQLRPGLTAEHKAEGILIAQSSTALHIDRDVFVEEIIRQGTTARKADVEAVVANIGVAIAALCGRGEAVSIPGFGILTPRVCGTMNAKREWINAPEAYLGFRIDAKLNADFQQHVQLEEIPATTIRPVIDSVTDTNSGTVNAMMTAGGMVGVKGKNLKFNALKPDEGIYFVPVNGGEAIKATRYLDNRYTRLTFEAPGGLTQGESYVLEIRVRRAGCKTLRVSDFAVQFSIA